MKNIHFLFSQSILKGKHHLCMNFCVDFRSKDKKNNETCYTFSTQNIGTENILQYASFAICIIVILVIPCSHNVHHCYGC